MLIYNIYIDKSVSKCLILTSSQIREILAVLTKSDEQTEFK